MGYLMNDMSVRTICTFCILFVGGCATEPITTVRYVAPDVPASLLTCAKAPDVPGPEATQRDVARYVTALSFAGAECRERLRAVSVAISGE